jgi:NADH-quinone oxidoreductase subunit A
MLRDYFPLLLYCLLAAAIPASMIAFTFLFGTRPKARVNARFLPFESGVSEGPPEKQRFTVSFYLTAMLFILFDIEVVFLIPWAFVYRDFLANNITILTPMLFFLFVLVLGLFYEVKKGALEWEK